jgi:ribonuclease P protein component
LEHPIEPTAESLWADVAARLRGALNEKTFGNWFSEVDPVSVDDDAFVLAVPNDFTRTWIEDHFLDLIRAAIREAVGTDRAVRLAVPKAAGNAVVLNRIKRKLREIWRAKLDADAVPVTNDYVLVVRAGLPEAAEARGHEWLTERVDEVLGKVAA